VTLIHTTTKSKKNNNLKYRQQYDSSIGNRSINLSHNYSIIDIYEINKKLIVSWGGETI
jgi:hypothetical protein